MNDQECQLCGALVQQRQRIHLHSEHNNSIRLVCGNCGPRQIERGLASIVSKEKQRYVVTYVETSRTTKTGEVFATHEDEAYELAGEKYDMPFRDDGDSNSWEVTVKEVELGDDELPEGRG
jgi:hypothetical protein